MTAEVKQKNESNYTTVAEVNDNSDQRRSWFPAKWSNENTDWTLSTDSKYGWWEVKE